ncbi:PIN-like domain-containing protein [Streptomyces sp. NPDC057521]|uniref:PIN-like domain-containing protein n=1 Tax=Streptomyces sp. NPDC057521 TaxID=3346156 RepID=UPI0036C6410D
MTSARSLFDGFEAQRTPTESDYRTVLRNGLVVLDTNVLLDLYRMSAPVREDMLTVLKSIAPRLWIPHQVQVEFWYVRQSNDLIEHHDKKASSARDTLRSTITKSRNALEDWVNNIHLGNNPDFAKPMHEKLDCAEKLLEDIVEMLEAQAAKDRVPDIRDTNKDPVIQALDQLLRGRVGAPYGAQRHSEEVRRAKERAAKRMPPGYMDFEKKDADEQAAGDYLVWRQLLDEAQVRQTEILFVTRDIKEDWWRNHKYKLARLPRVELVDELRDLTGRRLFMVEPSVLMQHVSKEFSLEKTVDSTSVSALRHFEAEESDADSRPGEKTRYRLAQVPGGRSADYIETVWIMAQILEENTELAVCLQKFMDTFPSVTLLPEARRRLMSLVSLGIADVKGERMALTDAGRRFVENRDGDLLRRLLMERIEGASEARELLREGGQISELKYRLSNHPELELSTTQSELLLRWMSKLKLLSA